MYIGATSWQQVNKNQGVEFIYQGAWVGTPVWISIRCLNYWIWMTAWLKNVKNDGLVWVLGSRMSHTSLVSHVLYCYPLCMLEQKEVS